MLPLIWKHEADKFDPNAQQNEYKYVFMRNFASKNSLKPLFKVNAQAKISHSKGVFVLFLLSIWVQFVCLFFMLHDAKITQ